MLERQIDPKDLARKLAHNSVLETIEQYNLKFPNKLKEVYEEPDDEHQELKYSDFAQIIFDERYKYYSQTIEE